MEVAKSQRFSAQPFLQTRYVFDKSMQLVHQLCDIAEQYEKSPVTVALAWLLKDKAVSSVIFGTRSVEQMADSVEAGSWDLPDEAYQKLKDALPCEHGYPCDWMEMALVPNFNKTEDDPVRAQRFPPLMG